VGGGNRGNDKILIKERKKERVGAGLDGQGKDWEKKEIGMQASSQRKEGGLRKLETKQ